MLFHSAPLSVACCCHPVVETIVTVTITLLSALNYLTHPCNLFRTVVQSLLLCQLIWHRPVRLCYIIITYIRSILQVNKNRQKVKYHEDIQIVTIGNGVREIKKLKGNTFENFVVSFWDELYSRTTFPRSPLDDDVMSDRETDQSFVGRRDHRTSNRSAAAQSATAFTAVHIDPRESDAEVR